MPSRLDPDDLPLHPAAVRWAAAIVAGITADIREQVALWGEEPGERAEGWEL